MEGRKHYVSILVEHNRLHYFVIELVTNNQSELGTVVEKISLRRIDHCRASPLFATVTKPIFPETPNARSGGVCALTF